MIHYPLRQFVEFWGYLPVQFPSITVTSQGSTFLAPGVFSTGNLSISKSTEQDDMLSLFDSKPEDSNWLMVIHG